ncbi:MAG: TylF/MycF family methyltransferase [Alphaproteobacteria bacterium]|nr:TylF/MycF family methyltransferase [Alphaproteobacteria bacterium]
MADDLTKKIGHARFKLIIPAEGHHELHYGPQGIIGFLRKNYDEDGMVLYDKNLRSLGEPHFQDSFVKGAMTVVEMGQRPKPVGTRFRAYLMSYFVELALRQPGSMVELGVNTGAFATMLCEYHRFTTAHLDRKFHLIDTFEGIPEGDLLPEEESARDHNVKYVKSQSYEKVRAHFSKYPQVEVIKGRVPEVLDQLDFGPICFLHIDMNNAHAERAGLERLWPHVVSNGVLLLDDYGFKGYEAQTRTIDAFAETNGFRVCVLPTGQGLVIKA